MKWVKVTERLPERAKLDYICRIQDTYPNENMNWITCFFDGKSFDRDYITHWLEITGPEEDFCEWEEKEDCVGRLIYSTQCGHIEPDYINNPDACIYDLIRRDIPCPNCGRKIKEVKP